MQIRPHFPHSSFPCTCLDPTSDWIVLESQFEPQKLHTQETVFTIGNGYLGTRGSLEERYLEDMAATLIHGIYDEVPVVYTELVNCPDWLPLTITIEGELFHLKNGRILSYQRRLDLKLGLLSRDVIWRSPKGHTLQIHFERFASLADQHILALRCQIQSLDFSGKIQVETSFNTDVSNQGTHHWQILEQGSEKNQLWLNVQTLQSSYQLAMTAQLRIEGMTADYDNAETCQLTATGNIQAGETIHLEKIVTLFTSRDRENPLAAAWELLNHHQQTSYSTLLAAHIAAWSQVWQDCDIIIEGDPQAQLALRYNLFQVMAATPRHDNRVSIPAKTLSGFAYRGHVFWDTDIFILPLLSLTRPDLARNLLMYRYNTLPGARRKAQEAGYEGAMYAWESATTGDEVTPRWVPGTDGEMIRIWCSDIELHITADVAYALWQYWQVTGDDAWMRDFGSEILLDTAVFWGSRAEWNADSNEYEIRDVIGPDENHEHINNNAFTNGMVQWHLRKALELWAWLNRAYPETATRLQQQLDLSAKRLNHWQDVAQKIRLQQDPETGLIEQCDGFFQLIDVNLADYEWRTRSMQALLGIEETNQRQILKQADVVMLLYLLREQFSSQAVESNWNYYAPRTDHSYGSSLSPAIHAIAACQMNQPQEAYTHFLRAALVDLEDVRHNAAEGIHGASAGGTWQAVVFGFAGVRFTQFGPVACPHFPPGWTRLKFRLRWQNQWYEFDLKAPEKPPIQAVIFDLDGVITDTAEFHYLGWKRLADEAGVDFNQTMNEKLRGLSRRDSLLKILGERKVTEAQLQEMMERKNRYYVDLIAEINRDHLLPGVENLLRELKQAGIKIALGSASKNAQSVIQRLGIADYFDVIADGFSVTQSKPAPDLFQFAAEKLGVECDRCLVIEDAEAGIEAALAAGMLAVGLGPHERVGNASVVLPSLDGVHWSNLQPQLIPVQTTPAMTQLV